MQKKPQQEKKKKRNPRPTISLRKQIDRLTEKEVFCLDAYLVNGDKRKAYLYSREKESTASEDSLIQMSNNWFRSEPVIAYLEYKGYDKKLTAEAMSENVDKQSIMFARIADILEDHTQDPEPRIAIQAAKALGDLYQLKNKPAEEAEERKHFYLPLRCDDCAIYKYAKEKNLNLNPNQ